MFFKKNKFNATIATLIFFSIFAPLNSNSETVSSKKNDLFSTNIEFENTCLVDYKTNALYCTLYFEKLSEYFMFTIDINQKDATPIRFFEMKNNLSPKHPKPLGIAKRSNQKTDFVFSKKAKNKSNFTLLVKYDEIEFKIYVVDTGLIQGTAKLFVTKNANNKKENTEEEIIIKVLPGDFTQEQ